MTGTRATAALGRAGVAFTEHTYTLGSAATSYGEDAAQRLGVDPSRVFKTLVAQADGQLVVAVVPVGGRLDLKALATAVGAKRAQLAEPASAERATGYVVGGISPLGQRRRLRTVVDASAGAHPTMYVSGGRRGLQVELSPTDLITLTGASVAPVGR